MDDRLNVWVYWHSEDRPAIVNKCIASWKRHLDSDKFKINVLSEENIQQYLSPEWLEKIPDFQSLEIANQADFIRLSLLKFYGGVWLDASIYLMQDLSFIENFNKFYAPRFRFIDQRNVQVFFIVAPKNDDTINKWLGLYTNLLRKKQKFSNKWYRLSMYSGIGLNGLGLILADKKFRTYFKVYEAYETLYCNDVVFRDNTPKFDDYGVKLKFRFRLSFRIVQVLKACSILSLSRLVIYLTNSTNDKDPLKLRKRAHDVWTKYQKSRPRPRPSITLMRDGKIVFYKMNALDRDFLAPDFRFEQEPSWTQSDEKSI